MTITCHLIAGSFDERRGGLEASVLRIAGLLSKHFATIYIYSFRATDESVEYTWPSNVKAVPLGREIDLLCEPLSAAQPGGSKTGTSAAAFLLLRAAITQRMKDSSSGAHIILSFYISHHGFIAQHVADSIGLPHIASVRGSDFTLDFRQPSGFAAVSYVVTRATCVVTTNLEQARTLATAFGIANRIVTIHNSVDVRKSRHTPPRTEEGGGVIRLVSDCGYSFKKGTNILLQAVQQLSEARVPVHLTLAGNADERQASYWLNVVRHYLNLNPITFDLLGWIPQPILQPMLSNAHIYVSATLGEGSSNARLHALVHGMPIVSTNCGELPDLVGDASHVALCSPGDAQSFRTELERMICRYLDGKIVVPDDTILHWRHRLSSSVEGEKWREIVERVIGVS